MKTHVAALCAALLMAGLQTGFSQSTVIKIVPFIGPYRTTPAVVQNAVEGIKNGTAAGTPGTPEYFEPLTGTTVPLSNLIFTYGFRSWMGQADPGGTYAEQQGNYLRVGFEITSSELFSLSQIWFSATGSTFSFSGTLGESEVTYDSQGVGIYWGADGVLGGGDDVYYWSGNVDTPVNQVIMMGFGHTIQADLGDGPTHQAAIDYTVSLNGIFCPDLITVEYRLRDTAASASILTVVPEPSTVSISVLGLLALTRFTRRKSL